MRCALASLCVAMLAMPAWAQPRALTVAAASDLQGVLPEVAAAFERRTGQTVRLTFGSSGNFSAQIQNGAPFDVFLSADIDYPRQLERSRLAEPGTLYRYATGQIVLFTTTGTGIDVSQGLEVLLSPTVRRIAIANPAHAPYGRAAVAALKSAGLYERVQAKLVLGENISQAAQFVQTGNAEVGLVARSIALMPALAPMTRAWLIPPGSYQPIEQAAIVIAASRNKAAARDFLHFLSTPSIRILLQRYGFAVSPAADH